MGHPAFAEARRHPASFVRPLPLAVGEALDERSRLPVGHKEGPEEGREAGEATAGKRKWKLEANGKAGLIGFGNGKGLDAGNFRQFCLRIAEECTKGGTPPPRNNDRSRNVADKKGDTKRAVVQDVGKQRCRVLSIT